MEHPTLSVPLPKWRLTCGAGVGESYQRHHAKNPPNMCAFLEQIVSRPACVFCRISDPSMGGAYLTLLNTIANLGITLPKIFIFAGARRADSAKLFQWQGQGRHVSTHPRNLATVYAKADCAGGVSEVWRIGHCLLSVFLCTKHQKQNLLI